MRVASLRSSASGPRSQPPTRFFRLSQLRRLRECAQVAAVCYRLRHTGVEFLLVQTRGGRWIFPKGSAEPGLTLAQSAALEAFEEAGVHGRIEEAPFTRYVRGKSDERRNLSAVGTAVSAHLCEVTRLETPQECDRSPTWFSPEKAKRHLRDRRDADYGTELARVVDRAMRRIRLFGSGTMALPGAPQRQALRAVQCIDGSWRKVSRLQPQRKTRDRR
jgi:8-oxo-dGTP pyrophosphatase MutT (NUDIX family)